MKATYSQIEDFTIDYPLERHVPIENSLFVDIETTGFSPVKNKIIEIGAVKIKAGEVVDNFSVFVYPQVPIPYEITQLTGIQDEMVMEAETIEKVLPDFVVEINGKTYIWEHLGMLDIPEYAEKWKRKKEVIH